MKLKKEDLEGTWFSNKGGIIYKFIIRCHGKSSFMVSTGTPDTSYLWEYDFEFIYNDDFYWDIVLPEGSRETLHNPYKHMKLWMRQTNYIILELEDGRKLTLEKV